MNKIVDFNQIRESIQDGMTIMVGGFMACGTPEIIVDAIIESGAKELTIICNDAGTPDAGVGKLIKTKQVKKLIASHIGLNPLAGQKMSSKEMEVELIPQGTLAEKIRSGGTGLGGILTPTGVGTIVAQGKEVITVGDRKYLLEEPLKADISIIYGSTVDEKGNVIYSKTTRNFNPLMAMAADRVICQAKKVVKAGEMDSDYIHTPHLFVDEIIKEEGYGY